MTMTQTIAPESRDLSDLDAPRYEWSTTDGQHTLRVCVRHDGTPWISIENDHGPMRQMGIRLSLWDMVELRVTLREVQVMHE